MNKSGSYQILKNFAWCILFSLNSLFNKSLWSIFWPGLVDGDLQLTGQERDFYDSLAYLLIAHEKLVTTIKYGDPLLDTVVPLSQVSFWLALLAQYWVFFFVKYFFVGPVEGCL